MTGYRVRRVDAVRLRLMPPEHVAVLVHISNLRRQSMSKVMRILSRKFDGDVSAYWHAACGPTPAPLRYGERILTVDEVRKLLHLGDLEP